MVRTRRPRCRQDRQLLQRQWQGVKQVCTHTLANCEVVEMEGEVAFSFGGLRKDQR